MRKLVLACFLVCGFFFAADAQEVTVDELKAMKAEKQAAIDALTGEVGDLDKQINEFPGWKFGGVGIVGFDLNSNSNWFAIGNPNSNSSGYGISASAFANKDTEKFFWRNLLTANLKQVNTTLNSELDDDVLGNKVDALTDALDISSLAGYKLAPKWALSGEGKYTSTVLNLNRPGKLTLSAGATWLPIDNMVVVIHPIGYEKNWPGDFVSSFGAKIGVQYAATIIPGVAWSSNLSAFIPYGSGDGTLTQHPVKTAGDPRGGLNTEYDLGADPIAGSELPLDYSTGDLTNWTWINSFSTNIFKGIGVGFNIGLRSDKQISNQAQYETWDLNNGAFTVPSDNPLQVYYSLGLSYTL